MTLHTKDVFVGSPDVTAHILNGPETDVIPETIDDFTLEDKIDAGYVNEDGVTITPSETTETIKDWSLNVVRRILTEFDGTVSWTYVALSIGALREYVGDDNIEVTPATASKGTQTRVAISGKTRPVKGWYFQVKDGDRRVLAFVPHGQITERGEIPLVASSAVSLPVTLSTYPDAQGNSIYLYTDDGVVTA